MAGKDSTSPRALLAMGVDTIALGFVGGSVGGQLQAGLTSLGIRTDFIQISGETRTNLSIVADDHEHYVKVNEPGPVVTESEAAALLDKIRVLVRPGDWWILAGSTPLGIQPAYVANIIDLVQEVEAYAVVDMQGDFIIQWL